MASYSAVSPPCGTCTRASENKHWGCPPRMSDGRLFTDYGSRCDINLRLMSPMSGSYDYRQMLISNGEKILGEWHDVRAFCAWAEAAGYASGLTIERIDNAGNYEPGNCRWIPNEKQASNTRRLTFIEAFGESRRVDEWAAIAGIKYRTIKMRLALGWTPEVALTVAPVVGRNQAGLPRALR